FPYPSPAADVTRPRRGRGTVPRTPANALETEEMDATTEQTSGSIQVEQENPSTDPPGKLDALYVQSMPEAVGLAYLLTGDLDLATEIGEEAFVRGAGRFEHRLGRVRFPTWLRRSVVTVFLLLERRAEADGTDRTEGDVPAPVEGRAVE